MGFGGVHLSRAHIVVLSSAIRLRVRMQTECVSVSVDASLYHLLKTETVSLSRLNSLAMFADLSTQEVSTK